MFSSSLYKMKGLVLLSCILLPAVSLPFGVVGCRNPVINGVCCDHYVSRVSFWWGYCEGGLAYMAPCMSADDSRDCCERLGTGYWDDGGGCCDAADTWKGSSGACCSGAWIAGLEKCCSHVHCAKDQTCESSLCKTFSCPPCKEPKDHQCQDKEVGVCCSGEWHAGGSCCGPVDCADSQACSSYSCVTIQCPPCKEPRNHQCEDRAGGVCCSEEWHAGGNCCMDNECTDIQRCSSPSFICTPVSCPECQQPKNHACVDKSSGVCCNGKWHPGGDCCGADDCDGYETCISNGCSALVCGACKVASDHACKPRTNGRCCKDEWFTNGDCCSDTDCADSESCRDHVCIPVNCEACYEPRSHQCVVRSDGICCGGAWHPSGDCCSDGDCRGGFACSSNHQCSGSVCRSGFTLCGIACYLSSSGRCCSVAWRSGAACCGDGDCSGGRACRSFQCSTQQCVTGYTPCGDGCRQGAGRCCTGDWLSGEGRCCSDQDCAPSEYCSDGTCTDRKCGPCEEVKDHGCIPRKGGVCCQNTWYPGGACCSDGGCSGHFACIGNSCSRDKCTEGFVLCGAECHDPVSGVCCSGEWKSGGACCTDGDCPDHRSCDPTTHACLMDKCTYGYLMCEGTCRMEGTGICCTNSWFGAGTCCTDADCSGNVACNDEHHACSSTECRSGFVLCGGVCMNGAEGVCCDGVWMEGGKCCQDDDCPGGRACVLNLCSENSCRPGYTSCRGGCRDAERWRCCDGLWYQKESCCDDGDCPALLACSQVTHRCLDSSCTDSATYCGGSCHLTETGICCEDVWYDGGTCCTDDECPGNRACEPSTHTCPESNCRDGFVFCDGGCRPRNTGKCIMGTWYPGANCLSDGDCSGHFLCDTSTYTCSKSTCVTGYTGCWDRCYEEGSGICCGLLWTGGGSCCTDEECPDDKMCVDHHCVHRLFPHDTPCENPWPAHEGELLRFNDPNYACDLFEVTREDLLVYVNEARRCCSTSCGEGCHVMCPDARSQYASGLPTDYYHGRGAYAGLERVFEKQLKKCVALYIIYGLGPAATFMKGYYHPEMCCGKYGCMLGLAEIYHRGKERGKYLSKLNANDADRPVYGHYLGNCQMTGFTYSDAATAITTCDYDAYYKISEDCEYGRELRENRCYVPQNELIYPRKYPRGWASDTDTSQNSCVMSDLPAHVSLNILKTGTCADYSIALTTLLRLAGFSSKDVMSLHGPDHFFNLVKVPGDNEYLLVDTTDNLNPPIILDYKNDKSTFAGVGAYYYKGDYWYEHYCDFDICFNDHGYLTCPKKREVRGC